MADDIDFNDALDNILFREETEKHESYERGFKDGIEGGNPEGYHLGYHRGAELGRELGYYLGIVTHHLEHSSKENYSEKIVKQLEKVKELIDQFPRSNNDNDDILGMADNIRSSYKKACALLRIPSNNPFDTNVSF